MRHTYRFIEWLRVIENKIMEHQEPGEMKHSSDLTSKDKAEYKRQHQILMMDHEIPLSDLIRKEFEQIFAQEKTCISSHCGSLSQNPEELEKWRNELITDLETAKNQSSPSQDIHRGVLELVTKQLAILN